MIRNEQQGKGERVLVMMASLVIVIAGLKSAGALMLPFLVAFFLAMISLPLLNWLQQRGLPTSISVLITIVTALAALFAIAAVIGGSIRDFTAQAPKYQERLEDLYSALLTSLEARGVNVTEFLGRNLFNPGAAMDVFTRTLRGIAGVLQNLVLVFLTITFILFEAAGFPAKLQAAFGHRESSGRFDKIKHEIQRYLGFKTLISLFTGLLICVTMTLIGIDFPLLWGALAFILNYIPNLGSILAGMPPTLLAAIQFGPGYALAVALVFMVINVTLGNLVEPYFMGRRLGLSTLVVFLSLVFWGWVWGPVGMLLSVPLTMMLKIMLENTEDMRWVAVLLDASHKKTTARRSGD